MQGRILFHVLALVQVLIRCFTHTHTASRRHIHVVFGGGCGGGGGRLATTITGNKIQEGKRKKFQTIFLLPLKLLPTL